MLWGHCPILDKPSEQENSYSKKRPCITLQYPQDSGNDRSKAILFLCFTGPYFKLQCKESVGTYWWVYQNKSNTAFTSGLEKTFFLSVQALWYSSSWHFRLGMVASLQNM